MYFTGGRPKDPIWKHFLEVQSNGKSFAKCRECDYKLVNKVARMKAHYQKHETPTPEPIISEEVYFLVIMAEYGSGTVIDEYYVIENPEPLLQMSNQENLLDTGGAENNNGQADAQEQQQQQEQALDGGKITTSPSPDHLISDGDASSRRSSGEEVVIEQICPRVNCPEKIVICLDLSSELEKMSFRSRSGDKFCPLKLIKRALGIFLYSKHRIDSRHEFALVIIQEAATWVRDFTTDPREILYLLDDLESTYPCETCDLSTLFQTVQDQVALPVVEGDRSVLPPPFIVRMIVLYGRSHCVPAMVNKEAQNMLYASPYFFADALYLHETPSEENQCESIYEGLCEMDQKGFSYIFDVSRNPTKLYDYMAQLLAHPLQRPLQKDTYYKIATNPISVR